MKSQNKDEQLIDCNWIDCNWIGDIKVYGTTKTPQSEVENYDDYDARCGLGGRFHTFRSRFDREE